MGRFRTVQVFFRVGQRLESALFFVNTPALQIKELFRAAAEVGPRDIIKLFNFAGQILNIDNNLVANTPDKPYWLQVVAVDTEVMIPESAIETLHLLEARITGIEKKLQSELPLPSSIEELQNEVTTFRKKLETSEALSWLGLNKKMREPITSTDCQKLQNRRNSDAIKKKVQQNFFNICEVEVSDEVRQWLKMASFDTSSWEDEELLLLLQQMYLDLDLCSRFAIDIKVLRSFLCETYRHYNNVPFHNFRHCFCVAQMLYAIAWNVDLPSKIGHLEVLILLTSCICHDLDHPGYNNIYQVNARTELALRYNDISPLENHHCSVAFRILSQEDFNIFHSFSNEEFKQIREGVIRCILATDMARHNEILTKFREVLPIFDFEDKSHVNLLCMVLIKVSDISNEARPMNIAEPWLDKLLMEFYAQSDAEKLQGLPVTPFMDRERITKPSSQCSFIGFVLLPLFEALGELLPELQDLIILPVREALEYYRMLNEANKEERLRRKSLAVDLVDNVGHNNSWTNENGVQKSFSNTSIKARARSCSTDEDTEVSTEFHSLKDQSLQGVIEGVESEDSETANEVEISEQTLKFKISTESTIPTTGRKSYPGSRKGSRERVQCLNHSELRKMMQRGTFKSPALSFDQHCLVGNKRLSFETPDHFQEYIINLRKSFEEVLVNKSSSDFSAESVGRNSDVARKENISEKECIFQCTEKKDLTEGDQTLNNKHSVIESKNKLAKVTFREHSPKSTDTRKSITNVECSSSNKTDSVLCQRNSSSRKPASGTKYSSILSVFRRFPDTFGLSQDSKENLCTANNNCLKCSPVKSKRRFDQDSYKASTLPKTKTYKSNKKEWKFLNFRKDSSRLKERDLDSAPYSIINSDLSVYDNHSMPSTSKTQSSTDSVDNSEYSCILEKDIIGRKTSLSIVSVESGPDPKILPATLTKLISADNKCNSQKSSRLK